MKNLTEAEEKYLNYDWKNDEKWKLYLSNLYPVPSINNIEKYKKKYYQKNVDKNFVINFTSDKKINENSSNNNTMNQNYNFTNNEYKGKLIFFIFYYYTFILFSSIFYFILLIFNIQFYKKFDIILTGSYFIAFLTSIILDYKTKKKISLIEFFANEKGQYTCYCILLFFIRDAILIYIPIFLTLLIHNYNIYKTIKHHFPLRIQNNVYLYILTSLIENNIFNIYMIRSNIEIYNLFFVIICFIFKRLSLLNLVIYIHFFKLKYNSNDRYFHACYSKNGELMRKRLSHPMVPKFFLNVFNKISHYFNVYLNYRR